MLTAIVELEFINFQTPAEDGYDKPSTRRNIGAFLAKHCPSLLRPLTSGMFGYSITRPMESKDFFYDIYDQSIQFTCPIECWHTESGPGVYEAAGSIQDPTIWSSTDITQALTVCDVNEMADRVTLFKYASVKPIVGF
jgi:glutamine synthetase